MPELEVCISIPLDRGTSSRSLSLRVKQVLTIDAQLLTAWRYLLKNTIVVMLIFG